MSYWAEVTIRSHQKLITDGVVAGAPMGAGAIMAAALLKGCRARPFYFPFFHLRCEIQTMAEGLMEPIGSNEVTIKEVVWRSHDRIQNDEIQQLLFLLE